LNERFYGAGLRFCLERVGSLEGKRVLEIGCGTGDLSALLASRGARVVGIDLCEAHLARARLQSARLGVADTCEFIHGNAEDFPLSDRSLDVVISKSTLQYMDRGRVLERCIRALAPDGALALNENLPGNPFIRVSRGLRSARARLGRDVDYARSIRGYLSPEEIRWLGGRFVRVEHREAHLARVLVSPRRTFPASRFGRRVDVAAEHLDDAILARVPRASAWAWLTGLVAQGPLHASSPSPVDRGAQFANCIGRAPNH